MKLTWKSIFSVALAMVLAHASIASAQTSKTIAVNFAADEPAGAGSAVVLENGPAGINGTVLWNNTTGASGVATGLLEGNSGEATFASVEWQSANTWSSQGRGEENNTAPAGNDRNLMSGYLDTSDVSVTTVTLKNLEFIGPYTVTVYAKGGVVGRAGDYTIGSQTIRHRDAAPFTGTYNFAQDGAVETGDVFFFTGVTGDTFTLSAKAASDIGGFRAPINGIEVTGMVPEPGTLGLAASCFLGLAGMVRRRLRNA